MPPKSSLPVAFCLVIIWVSSALAAPGADWPLYRRDVRLTSHSPGKGKLTAPVLRWRAFLGGRPAATRAHDADLDGTDDVLAIEGGSLSARSWSGGVLWKSAPNGAKSIVSIGDLNGDGLDDVVARLASGVQVLSSISGGILWTSPSGLFPKLHYVHVADFDGDGVKDIVLADQGGVLSKASGAVRVYRLKGTPGLLAATPEVLDKVKARGDTVRAVDVDGDSLPDLYMPIHEADGTARVYAFSGKTGKLLAKAKGLDHAGCHQATALVQPSGPPLVICAATASEIMNSSSMRGAYAMQQQGEKLVRKWKYLVPDETSDRFQSVFVGDADGDGKTEIVASEHVAGFWRVQVVDVQTGKALAQLAGNAGWLASKHIKVREVFKVGSEGPFALRCSVGEAGTDGPGAQTRLIRWSRVDGFSAFADLGKGSASRPGGQEEALTSADFVVRRDEDGDGKVDRVVLARVASDGGVKVLAQRQFKQVPFVGPGLSTPSGRRLLIGTDDGFVRVVDMALKTVNDSDGDGHADLTYGGASNPRLTVARVKDDDLLPLVLVGASDRLRVFDPAGAGPLAAPALKASYGSGPGGMLGTLVDLDGDGSRELVVRHRPVNGSATITAWSNVGAELWSYTHPGVDLFWATNHGDVFAPVDVNYDGAFELMLGYREPGTKLTDAGRYTLLNGKTGASMWAPGRPCSKLYGTTFSVDDSGKSVDAILSIYTKRHRCRLSDGEILSEAVNPAPQYGVPMLRDLDDDGDLDVILTESFKSIAVEKQPGHGIIWQVKGDYYHKRSTLLPSGKDLWIATAVGAEPAIQLLDAHTGKVAWQRRYAGGKALADAEQPPSLPGLRGLISVADLAGDGQPSLIFHTTDGWLYAVSAVDGAIRWVMDWGGVVGDPIVADVDGDGQLEILLTSPDGYLNALDHDVLGNVAWVRENKGNGPATSAAEDIDEQESSARIHLNWSLLPGAHGYAVQVADSDGGVILPLGHVGPSTSMTVDGLNMHLGRTYITTVRAWFDGNKGKQYSRPGSSDGVKVVDLSVPWINDLRAKPSVVAKQEGDSLIQATLHDKTRLERVTVTVKSPDGEQVASWNQPLAVRDHELSWSWSGLQANGTELPAGSYKVVVVARDGAGHEASAHVDVIRCGQGEVVISGGCAAPMVEPDVVTGSDVHSDISTQTTIKAEPESCCHASATPGRGGPMTALTVLLLALCLAMRRSAATLSRQQGT